VDGETLIRVGSGMCPRGPFSEGRRKKGREEGENALAGHIKWILKLRLGPGGGGEGEKERGRRRREERPWKGGSMAVAYPTFRRKRRRKERRVERENESISLVLVRGDFPKKKGEEGKP